MQERLQAREDALLVSQIRDRRDWYPFGTIFRLALRIRICAGAPASLPA